MRVAAVVLLILAVGIPTVFYSVNNLGGQNTIEKSSTAGVMTVDLPDGSRVFLNEGSTLEYSKNYVEKRDVMLKGEGYFAVMSDPQKPFIVNTGKVVVTVLGTTFNIKETSNETVEVFVESGRVRMDLKEENESLILSPGEVGEANGLIKKSELSNSNYLSWKTKEFKFVDESIHNILEVLEAAYHVEVKSNIPNLNQRRLTTTYSEMSFEAILSTICTALELNYKKEGKVYILRTN
jgi:ferric-dicitrate binding protein FerR (iron transport regulator)